MRPAVQFTALASSARTSDAEHTMQHIGFPASVVAREYKASGNSAGAALGLGMTFGPEMSYELGVELTTAKFDGTYQVPELSYDFPPSSIYSDFHIPAVTAKCSFSIRMALATFRRKFGSENDRMRPYLECVGGLYDYEIKEQGRHPSLRGDPFDGSRDGGLIGAGVGASLKLFSHLEMNLGYRLTASISSRGDDFYKLAHSLSLGIALRI